MRDITNDDINAGMVDLEWNGEFIDLDDPFEEEIDRINTLLTMEAPSTEWNIGTSRFGGYWLLIVVQVIYNDKNWL